MNKIELIKWFQELISSRDYLDLDQQTIELLDKDIAIYLAKYYQDSVLIKLPPFEIAFFEWMRQVDYSAWSDLWTSKDIVNSDEQHNEPYIVSISFLPNLLDKHRGLPICDLLEVDNYYFTEDHIVGKESGFLLDSIKSMFLEKKKLTIAQMLLLEISFFPIDIWHFAYKHKLDLSDAKNAVKELVDDNVLLHLVSAEHIAGFIE